jgi:hypothetical protein
MIRSWNATRSSKSSFDNLPNGPRSLDIDFVVLVRLRPDELGNLAWREAEIGPNFALVRMLGPIAGISDPYITVTRQKDIDKAAA